MRMLINYQIFCEAYKNVQISGYTVIIIMLCMVAIRVIGAIAIRSVSTAGTQEIVTVSTAHSLSPATSLQQLTPTPVVKQQPTTEQTLGICILLKLCYIPLQQIGVIAVVLCVIMYTGRYI